MTTPSFPALQRALGAVVRRTSVPRVHQRVATRAGVDIEQVEAIVLSRIVDAGEIRVSDLAQWLGVVCSTASRHVAHLASRGLVERQPDAADGRAVIVSPTAAGRALLARLRAAHSALLEESLTGWTDSEVQQLTAALARFADDLEDLVRPDGDRVR